jgi:hypothetical protein
METVGSSDVLVNTYQTALRRIPEKSNPQTFAMSKIIKIQSYKP